MNKQIEIVSKALNTVNVDYGQEKAFSEIIQELQDLKIDKYELKNHKKKAYENLLNVVKEREKLHSQLDKIRERATPKKVVYDETNDMDICCNCGGNVYHHQHTNNCGDCGQALDWGDEE